MPQFIFTELPIHVKTEQHAPTVCSHLTFKPVVFVFQWGLLKKQDLLNPKNKKKSKTKARAKGLQTCKNSGNCQQSWNTNELYIHPELTMNLFQPSSTDPVNNTVQGGLNMSSETGRITSIRCEWATAAEEMWSLQCSVSSPSQIETQQGVLLSVHFRSTAVTTLVVWLFLSRVGRPFLFFFFVA